jgi:hypothetical protein
VNVVANPSFGDSSYNTFIGDWDGDGVDTPGIFDANTGTWILRNSWTASYTDAYTGDITITGLGGTGALPVIGDWDGDGVDTVGYTVNGTSALEWTLADSNQTGTSVTEFDFGAPGYLPVAWNVPEPTTLALLATGGALGLLRKRK